MKTKYLLMNKLPEDIKNIIYKYLHKIYIKECLIEISIKYTFIEYDKYGILKEYIPELLYKYYYE